MKYEIKKPEQVVVLATLLAPADALSFGQGIRIEMVGPHRHQSAFQSPQT